MPTHGARTTVLLCTAEGADDVAVVLRLVAKLVKLTFPADVCVETVEGAAILCD